ncbi:MAG: HD domain-containing protein [Clostridiales bacterium]|nr:HD domain-containing protein [Clostridiales bacterium]
MIEYEKGCPHRVGHFLKVYGYAKTIGELEGLEADERFVLETAALVHDIGIKPSLEKYGASDGSYQELEGPAAARATLEALGFDAPVVDRVCWLVGHHHSYADIDGRDHQILIEADFLVNIHEGEMGGTAIRSVRDKIFKTKAGRRFLETIYGHLLEG